MLNASRSAAHWMGLRKPLTPEPEILSVVDRFSADGDLFARCAPPEENVGGNVVPQLRSLGASGEPPAV